MNLGSALKEQGTRLADLLLPPSCFSCAAPVEAQGELCADCWSELSHISAPMCDQCGLPFEHSEGGEVLCGACIANSPAYDRARSVLRYDDVSRPLILGFKHLDKLEGAGNFGRSMWRAVSPSARDGDIIVPVPLHRRRLWKRRFNQSAILAHEMAKVADIPVRTDIIHRHRATPSQGKLSRLARQKNVRGAFRIEKKAQAQLKDRTIILVDDVMTTGATIDECARVLKRAGVKTVVAITHARVVRAGHSQI